MNPFKRWSIPLIIFFWLPSAAPALADTALTPPLDLPAFEGKLKEDSEIIQTYRKKLSDIADYVLMDAVPPEGLKKEIYRGNLRETWVSFLDYLIALESIGRSYGPLLHSPNPGAAKEAFDTSYWIFLAEYHYAAQFVKNLDGLPDIEAVLNGPIPELDLPSGSYSALEALVRGGGKTAELFSKDKIYFSFGTGDQRMARQAQTMEDKNAVLRFCSPLKLYELKKIGEGLPEQDRFSSWIPLEKALPIWKGKTSFWRAERTSLSTRQVEFLLGQLEPGDILLTRKEWYFPNVGLPGYWSQAALYTGDEAQRELFFNEDGVRAWLKTRGQKGGLNNYLKKQFHDLYPSSLKLDGKGRPLKVLEAVPEGVLFASLEWTIQADSLCVLRPRLSTSEKADALFRAFRCVGKPYDFDFDFESDSRMTGAEVLAYSYKPEGKFKGLDFPRKEMLGNFFSSPNLIAEQFDESFGTPGQRMDLVVFLEPEQPAGQAQFNGLGEFRQSWKKPKWASPAPPPP